MASLTHGLVHIVWKTPGGPWRPGQQGQACIKILHYQQPGARGEEVAAKTSLQGAALFQLTVKSSKLANTSQLGQLDASVLQARSVRIYSKNLEWDGSRSPPVNVDMKCVAKPNSKKCLKKAIPKKNHGEHIWDLAPTFISNSMDVLVLHTQRGKVYPVPIFNTLVLLLKGQGHHS